MYEEEELEVESKSIDEDTLAEWVKKGNELCSYSRFDEAEELLNRAAAAGYEPARVAIEEMKNKKDAEERFFACSEIKDGVLVRYNGKDATVKIPDSLTGIGNSAFSHCSSLKSVIIGNSVTNIQDGETEYLHCAFYGCSSLENITIPKSLTRIGEQVFYGCRSIKRIIYTGDIKSWCKIKGLTNLMEYTASDYTLTIDGKEIKGEFTVPNDVKIIEDNAFFGCGSLTRVVIPGSVTSIGEYAFFRCDSLTDVTIENGVKKIGWGCFYRCDSLKRIAIPSSLTDILGAFDGCPSLEIITVESGNPKYHSAGNCLIETATKRLVLGCKNSMIPDDGSVTRIEDGAFNGSSELTSIAIPSSVTEIDFGAFLHCDNLAKIIYGGSKMQWKMIANDQAFRYIHKPDKKSMHACVVHCSDGKIKEML